MIRKPLIINLIIFIAYIFVGCKSSNDNVVQYNYFDTFTLTPENIDNKTSLKVVCNYSDGHLSSVTFKDKDKLIIRDTILY